MSIDKLLKQIDEQQAKIDSYGKFDDSVLKTINYKFRLDWNYYSNRMEGGTLTREETRSVMVGNISIEGKPIKDVMEMNGHDKVVLEILRIGKGEQRLSEKRILEIHKSIMHEEDPEKAKQIGKWKTLPNEIINYKNEKIGFVPPSEVPSKMHSILDLVNAQLDAFFENKKDKRHPLLIASDFHLNYVSIHPFYDGNGRTARIFMNLVLISCGLPVIIIRDEDKDRYYRSLADIQAYGGNPHLFYQFIGERIIDSQAIILKALNGEDIEEPEDLDKRISLLKKKLGNDDQIKERKNTQSIYKVLADVAFPLFKVVQQKCENLNDFFLENSNNATFTPNGGQFFQIKSKDQSWDMVKETWLGPQFLSQQEEMRSFQFEYYLEGFKKSVNAQSLHTRLTFWFDDYNYTIMTLTEDRQNGLKKTYTDELTVVEINKLVKKIIDPMLDQIDRYLENK